MLMMNYEEALQASIKIAEAAASGGNTSPAYVLETTFNTLLELLPKANSSYGD